MTQTLLSNRKRFRSYIKKTTFLLGMGIGMHSFVFAQNAEEIKKVEYPEGYTEALNVVYTRVDSWEGRMDLYLPPKSGVPSPAIINIHGGGWNHGSKESQTGFSSFFKKGYAVANISYRLVHEGTAPAAVQDARCALIYLIKNAQDLNIDPDKIVIMGSSAGGHLALMAGLMENDHRFDKNCFGVEDIKVAAIIDKFGVVDLTPEEVMKAKSVRNWLGPNATDQSFARTVSPIHQVKKSSPPVFIVHGDADPTVPYEQSVELHKKLQKAGVKTEFITVPGGVHGKFSKEQSNEITAQLMAFLKSLGIHN